MVDRDEVTGDDGKEASLTFVATTHDGTSDNTSMQHQNSIGKKGPCYVIETLPSVTATEKVSPQATMETASDSIFCGNRSFLYSVA